MRNRAAKRCVASKNNNMCSAQWVDVEHGNKNMTRYTDTYGIFFGIERRMRNEEMEEKCNKEVEKGWMLAADAVEIIDEKHWQ